MPTEQAKYVSRSAPFVLVPRSEVASGQVFSWAKDGRPQKKLYANFGTARGVKGRIFSLNLESRNISHTAEPDKQVAIMGRWRFVMGALDQKDYKQLAIKDATLGALIIMPEHIDQATGKPVTFAILGKLDNGNVLAMHSINRTLESFPGTATGYFVGDFVIESEVI